MIEKTGFVYIWYDRKHHRFYIGSHLGLETDNYICSSTWMKNSFKRRPKDFKRKILKRNIPRSELNIEEHKWLSLIKEEELGKRYYNLRNHRFGHWSNTKNIEPWNKGKYGYKIHSEEYKQYVSVKSSGSNNYFFGKHPPVTTGMLGKTHSDETRAKMSKSLSGRICHTDETKSKIGKKNSEHMKLKWQDPVYREYIISKRKFNGTN